MYLDVEHSEAQVKEFGPGAKYIRKCSITIYAHDNGTTINLASRKLENIGYVKSYGGMHNDPERLHHLLNRVELSQSFTIIAGSSSRSSGKWPQKLRLNYFKRIMM
jgi:hypothetical protein